MNFKGTREAAYRHTAWRSWDRVVVEAKKPLDRSSLHSGVWQPVRNSVWARAYKTTRSRAYEL